MDLKVGDKVLLVFDSHFKHKNPEETTIKKIGKKWIYTNHPRGYRAYKDTLQLCDDSFYSGKMIVDIQKYKKECAIDEAWHWLKVDLSRMRSIPQLVTLDSINEARKLLGIDGQDGDNA